VWTLWRRTKSHTVSQIEPHFLGRPAHGLVTALTTQSQLRHTHHCVTFVHCNITTAATIGGGRVYRKLSRENGSLKRRTRERRKKINLAENYCEDGRYTEMACTMSTAGLWNWQSRAFGVLISQSSDNSIAIIIIIAFSCWTEPCVPSARFK